jgi:hypothetical protein
LMSINEIWKLRFEELISIAAAPRTSDLNRGRL